MSSQVLVAIVLPIVVAIVLVVWIGLVMHASKHPGHRGQAGTQRPRRQVAGGAFRATGGRQVTPRPDEEPSGPTSGYESNESRDRR